MAENKDTGIFQEPWIKGVTITTTVLAVLTAIGAARSAYSVAQTQTLTALEGSKWAYYQAKSIKENMIDVQIKSFEYAQLGATTEQQKTYVQNALKSMRGELSRYEKEKEDIMADAQKTGAASAKVSRRGGNFSMSVVFFQIGIMLSSVSALLKRKEMWILGLICGLPALILLANGVLLFF